MRDIRFRAWDKYETKWMYFEIGESFGQRGDIIYKSLCLEGTAFYQFTGLLDKNGKEIYEGDIVRFIDTEVDSNESGTNYEDLPMVESIVWNDDECGWDVSSRNYIDRTDFLDQCADDVEVIGNIYENPELLK